MWKNIRDRLIGRDDDHYYEPRLNSRPLMAEKSYPDRFVYCVILPPLWLLFNWMDKWDINFRNRYSRRSQPRFPKEVQ